MNISKRLSIVPMADACGELQELYNSENLSISYSTIIHETVPHKHNILEEVYVVVKGKAKIKVGDECFDIEAGDTFAIPKNTYHHITEIEEPIELIVVTHPKFRHDDLIY